MVSSAPENNPDFSFARRIAGAQPSENPRHRVISARVPAQLEAHGNGMYHDEGCLCGCASQRRYEVYQFM